MGAPEADAGARAPSFRPPEIPNYEIETLVGEGGMGRVFRAIDRRLRRPVALKVIRGDDHELVERFLHEARAQARIEHPNVCKVFEAGEANGLPYIAMQFLNGRSLADEARNLTLEEKVLVVRDAADALQAAHRLGIVHRDLKPANIIVDRDDARGIHAYIVDFGLARDLGAEGLTVRGTLLGTPAYMSPEQTRGDSRAVDRRSDVYSLGATLYAALAGHPPFRAASTFDLLAKVVGEDPESLLADAPAVPRDVETIVSKCLEKEPGRRYQSAADLRDDLTRYLEGEPISARGASLAYRLGRKARKHRLVLGVAAVALAVLLVAALDAFRSRRAAAERARLAQEFGQEAERVEWIVRASQQSPLHDTTPERELVSRILRGLSERTRPGGAAREAALFALGRGALAVGDTRRARELLEESWNLGSHGGDVAYALGLALSRLYVEELRDVERLGDERLRAARREDLRRRYIEPALSYLKLGTPPVTASPEYVEALIALHEGRVEDASRLAGKAVARLPWLHEAVLLQGDIALAAGREHRKRGEYGPALLRLREATEQYRKASEVSRSAAEAYEAECAAWAEILYVENDLGADPAEAYGRSLQACGRARTANPSSAPAYHYLGFAEWQWGQRQLADGQSPVEALKRSIAASEEAQRLRPDWAEAYNDAGIAYGYLGRSAMGRGEDPRPLVRLAITNIEKALSLDPDFAYAHTTRGLGYLDLARDAASRGENPGPFFDTAVASLRRALALAPHWLFPRSVLATALTQRGLWESRNGVDPSASLEGAISELTRLLDEGDASADTHQRLGDAYVALADAERSEKKLELLRKAEEHYRSAVERSPRNAAAREKLASTLRRLTKP